MCFFCQKILVRSYILNGWKKPEEIKMVLALKFSFSEKATKNLVQSASRFWHCLVTSKPWGWLYQIFVAFSEKLNFKFYHGQRANSRELSRRKQTAIRLVTFSYHRLKCFFKERLLVSSLSSIRFFCRKECCSKSQRGNSNGRYKILHIYVYKKDISKRVPKRIDKALHGLQKIRQWCMWNGVSCISSKRWEKSRHQRVSSLLRIQIYFYFSEDIDQLWFLCYCNSFKSFQCEYWC